MQTIQIKTFQLHRSHERSVSRSFEFQDMYIQNRPNCIPSFDSVLHCTKCVILYFDRTKEYSYQF